MSIHIKAKFGEIAPVVIMPGDPIRAKYISDNFLEESKLVSDIRNNYFYTGFYNGKKVTVGSSGMGCPSMGIYSFELYNEYDVDTIIRVGTSGSYYTEVGLYSIVNVISSYSESTFAKSAFGMNDNFMLPTSDLQLKINEIATSKGIKIHNSPVHCTDTFYKKNMNIPEIAISNNCISVEMESFALFANAKYLDKNAACLLTISDIIPTLETISSDSKETNLNPMIDIALSCI